MHTRFDLLGFGVAAADELIVLDEYPPPDVKVDVVSHQTQAGGICINALVAAARLGLRCHFAGSLGSNPLSGIVHDCLNREGVSFERPRQPGAGPSHAFIIIDRSRGSRTILMDKELVQPLSPDDLPSTLISQTRMLYVDSWHLEAGLHAVRVARRHNVEVIADFEEYEPERVLPLLSSVDHLIVPLDYARRLTMRDGVEEVLRTLAEEGRTCTAVTCGRDGCYFMSSARPDEIMHQGIFKIEVVDTTGCGDAFHGAYAAAALGGRTVESAIEYASAAAALCARAVGAQSALPKHEEVEALMAEGRSDGGSMVDRGSQ